MTMSVVIKSGIEAFAKGLGVTLPRELEAGIMEAAQQTTTIMRRHITEVFPSGRTGALGRSYKETFFGWQGGGVSAGVLSDLVYAGILDEGGTVRARTVKSLAVPIMGGRSLPVGKWPRHFAKGELTFIARKGRAPILAQVSKRGVVRPLFVLKPSVTIRGRGYVDEVATQAELVIAEILGDKAQVAVEKAPGGEGET